MLHINRDPLHVIKKNLSISLMDKRLTMYCVIKNALIYFKELYIRESNLPKIIKVVIAALGAILRTELGNI